MLRGILARKAAHVTLIILLGALVYANSVGAPFHFDDAPNIVDNPLVKDVSYFTDTARGADFKRYDAFRSRYIGFLTFFLNYRSGGLDVEGYHIVNIVIHIITALLVYALVMLSFRTPVLRASTLSVKRCWIALLAASLFMVHPVNTQAVTYIVQRFASLVALFYLGSMVCYINARLSTGKGRWVYYTGALVLALLAMKTKENAFTLPLAVVLFEFVFFRGEPPGKRALLLVPLMLTMLIIPLTLVDLDMSGAEVMSDISEKTEIQHVPRGAYLLTELRVMATYLRLLVLPMNQNLDYDYPLYTSMAQSPVLLSLVLVAALMGLAAYLYRRQEPAAKLAAFGILFFFLALSVESTLVPLFPIYEHRVYLPGVGMIVAGAVGAMHLHGTIQGKWQSLITVLFAVSVITLSAQTARRNIVWQSDVALWSDVVEKSPESIRGYSNLGRALGDAGRVDEAIGYLQKAINLKSGFAASHQQQGISEAYDNLGIAYFKQNDFQKAMENFQLAIRYRPDNAKAHLNLGTTYANMGLTDKAIEQFNKTIVIDPTRVSGHFNLGMAYANKRLYEQAREQLKQVLRIDPLYADAYFSLGVIALRLGNKELARKRFAETLQLDPGHAKARKFMTEAGR